MSATVATRSGLSPQNFDVWLEQTARLDREAAKHDSYAVATLILSDLGEACRMAKLIEQAGLRVLEFNIGTPYASVTTKGNVTTEFDPARVTAVNEVSDTSTRVNGQHPTKIVIACGDSQIGFGGFMPDERRKWVAAILRANLLRRR